MNSLYNTLTDIYACLRLLIALACIVLAIIIICKKEKATKMLGISILMISSAVLVSFVLSLSYRGMREYERGVTDGMTEVQDPSKTLLLFVLFDDVLFDHQRPQNDLVDVLVRIALFE